MRQVLTSGLLWFSAIGCGMLAGVYFAFSTFVMASLARIPAAAGIAAMNAINTQIVKSPFMAVFFGTTLTAVALVILALFRLGQPGTFSMLAAGAIYVVGMFVVTLVFNVPLNDALANVDPSSAEGATLWARYVQDWTVWNHVRTVASTSACILLIAAIATR
ncbi:DUF1772 domain-containing protein [Paraburkholderia guartelaensis]|jgi:uncharacterized membrane protein|uniref:DUF1772 domain-containing protein n=1 Tax=Paraburkholderia guartelaensis TaxID=2546446 RepID=A0A4R5LLJ6_9BURK|nr:anthrone oxygenase family protein [Paraburkholderia guartelaensis]TDG10699.1 DUF1772 domain-containing protein [Paraburkholderia guartelaensis]